MNQPSISSRLAQANFGRTSLSSSGRLLARHYRLINAALICGLLIAHLPLVGNGTPLLVALVSYMVYALIRSRLPYGAESWIYQPTVQLIRAQIGILWVTVLVLWLAWYGNAGDLWILYIPALFLTSRYFPRQKLYLAVLCEVVLLATVAHWIELRQTPLTAFELSGEMSRRIFAVVVPGFLLHYLSWVDITARQGAKVRDSIVRKLLQQALLTTDGLSLWRGICDACREAVNAHHCDIYLYDAERAQLRRIEETPAGSSLDGTLNLMDSHLAAEAFRLKTRRETTAQGALSALAAPIWGHAEADQNPLAVVVLFFEQTPTHDRRTISGFIDDLLQHIWPICTYAALRQQFPWVDARDQSKAHSLCLDDVLDVVLETLCDRLGFAFATISLVDEDRQEIRTVRGRNVPSGWIEDAHHPLDSHDIQADVLRTGNVEVIDAWDSRFDERIWTTYKHAELVRVWVPLGCSGTIEAGFPKVRHRRIPPQLVELLCGYAKDVTVAIQNAQLYQQQQRRVELLARLNQMACDLQTDPGQRDEGWLRRRLAEQACTLLGGDVTLLYARNRADDGFDPPVVAGAVYQCHIPLSSPNDHRNIVNHIAATREPYYQPDAQHDPLLVEREGGGRTFTQRQQIVAFAGAPLLARGKLLGVLCVNYRRPCAFGDHQRQVIALFAQQAAAVIAGGQLVREQERRRLEYDLHDGVKSSLRGLILLSKAATKNLTRSPETAREYLHEIRRAGWGILSDVELILNDLTPNGHNHQALQNLFADEVKRLAGRDSLPISLWIDPAIDTLPLDLVRALLHVLREALINALEHSQAHTISVALTSDARKLQLIVSDDGIGFDVATALATEQRGLLIMQERAMAVGGHVQITSGTQESSHGTTVCGICPRQGETDDT